MRIIQRLVASAAVGAVYIMFAVNSMSASERGATRFVIDEKTSTASQAHEMRQERYEQCAELCATYLRATIRSLHEVGQLTEIWECVAHANAWSLQRDLAELEQAAAFVKTGNTLHGRPHKTRVNVDFGDIVCAYSTLQAALVDLIEAIMEGDSAVWLARITTKKSLDEVAEKLKKLITEEDARARHLHYQRERLNEKSTGKHKE